MPDHKFVGSDKMFGSIAALVELGEDSLARLNQLVDQFRKRRAVTSWLFDSQYRKKFTVLSTALSDLSRDLDFRRKRMTGETHPQAQKTDLDKHADASMFIHRVDDRLHAQSDAKRAEPGEDHGQTLNTDEKRMLFRLYELRKRITKLHAEEVANREVARKLEHYVDNLRRVHASIMAYKKLYPDESNGVESRLSTTQAAKREWDAIDNMYRRCVTPARRMYAEELNRFAGLQARERVTFSDVTLSLEEASSLLTSYKENGHVPIIEQVREEWEATRKAGAAEHLLHPDYAVDYSDMQRMIRDCIDELFRGASLTDVGNVRSIYHYVTEDLPDEIRRAVCEGSERDVDGFVVNDFATQISFTSPEDEDTIAGVQGAFSALWNDGRKVGSGAAK